MSVFQLISFLFCFRYSGHNSVLYIELCLEYLKHVSFYRYHVGARGGNCFIFFYTSICQGWGGGGGFLIVFSFCIPMLHATHGRSVVKLLHSLEVSHCPCLAYSNKIMSVLPNFFQLCLCCDH